ncbi:MAG: hypothetical protein WC480_00750 [Patescibacteria group bacterium]
MPKERPSVLAFIAYLAEHQTEFHLGTWYQVGKPGVDARENDLLVANCRDKAEAEHIAADRDGFEVKAIVVLAMDGYDAALQLHLATMTMTLIYIGVADETV